MGLWMDVLDERILEYLDGVHWSDATLMSRFGGVEATPERVDERCRVLARLGYVEPALDGGNPEETTMWELGYWGKRYLAGEVDAEMYRPVPAPRPPEAVRPGSWTDSG